MVFIVDDGRVVPLKGQYPDASILRTRFRHGAREGRAVIAVNPK